VARCTRASLSHHRRSGDYVNPAARVHAVFALAAATALHGVADHQHWFEAAGTHFSPAAAFASTPGSACTCPTCSRAVNSDQPTPYGGREERRPRRRHTAMAASSQPALTRPSWDTAPSRAGGSGQAT
jgi:hypothetical protein